MPSTTSPMQGAHDITIIALMAALIAAGALFHIQIGPVPITFQDCMIALAGFILGPRKGVYTVATYLTAGALGLPVFSGGRGGLGMFLGPTGGYLIGFLFLALAAGLGGLWAKRIQQKQEDKQPQETTWRREALPLATATFAAFLGFLVLYAAGLLGLCLRLDMTFQQAFTVGVLPFLPFGPAKACLAAMLWRTLQRKGVAR